MTYEPSAKSWESLKEAIGNLGKMMSELPEAVRKRAILSNPYLLSGKMQNNDLLEVGRWLNVIKHPSVIIILGNRGSGKSALGYKLLEYFRYLATLYVVALPQKAREYLPEWIGSVPSIEDIPQDTVNLIDESYNLFHSRASSSERARILSTLINLSRQRKQTLIFVTQEARQIDRNIVSSANIIIFKNPGILQLEFERKELRRLSEEAKNMFAAINNRYKNKWAYVYAPGSDFIGMLQNSTPSFWTPSLSRAYADNISIAEIIMPRNIVRDERIKMAKELHRQGFSLGYSKKVLGVSRSTVKNYIADYPYGKKRGGADQVSDDSVLGYLRYKRESLYL